MQPLTSEWSASFARSTSWLYHSEKSSARLVSFSSSAFLFGCFCSFDMAHSYDVAAPRAMTASEAGELNRGRRGAEDLRRPRRHRAGGRAQRRPGRRHLLRPSVELVLDSLHLGRHLSAV